MKVSIQTQDGVTLRGRMFEPESRSDIAILHVPGMSGDIYSIPFFETMSKRYPLEGVSFLATESRAHHSFRKSKNTSEPYTDELFVQNLLDIDTWINYLLENNYSNIWIQSNSFGPTKVVRWFYEHKPKNISGLIFLSPSDMWGLVRDPEGMKDHKIMLPQAQELVNEGKGGYVLDQLLWGVKRITARSYLDIFNNPLTAVFNYHNSDLGWDTIASIDVPVIAFTGTEDDGIVSVADPHKAMKMLEQWLAHSSKKKTIVYEGGNHNFIGFEAQVTEDVLDFIKE